MSNTTAGTTGDDGRTWILVIGGTGTVGACLFHPRSVSVL